MPKPVSLSIFLKFFLAFLFLGIFPFTIAALFLIAGYESVILQLTELLDPVEQISQTQAIESTLAILRVQAFLTIIILIALIMIGSIVLGKIFTGPVKNLLGGVQEITKGNYTVRVPVQSLDEIGQVSGQFNEMAGKLQEVNEREAALSRSKNEFITIVAHQLRTPTSAVKWAIQLVLEGDVGAISKKQRWALDRGYAANEHMIRLIGDLLDVSRIEEGRFGYEFKQLDILPVLKQSAEEFSILAKEKGITLHVVAPARSLPKVYIDQWRINLALSNLLSNAIHYTPRGGTVTLKAKIIAQEKALEVMVRDTGIGISKEEKSRLFSKFFRGTQATHMYTEGSGLGLFIVQNIVSKHGGKVSIESEKQKGTTVSFTIPLTKRGAQEKKSEFHEFLGNI
jgi:signal transduction histidine kinase